MTLQKKSRKAILVVDIALGVSLYLSISREPFCLCSLSVLEPSPWKAECFVPARTNTVLSSATTAGFVAEADKRMSCPWSRQPLLG